MQEMNVQLTTDYLQNNSKVSPTEALSELVWNALDADSTVVKVEFSRDELEGINEVRVIDNGHGIAFSKLPIEFGNLGNSEKLAKRKTPNGRGYHGRYGSGRYKSLSLGTIVKWHSTFNETFEDKKTFDITCTIDEPTKFLYSMPVKAENGNGVVVQIEGIFDKVSNKLNNKKELINILVKQFAAYLLAYPGIQLIVDDHLIDPRAFIEDEFTQGVSIEVLTTLIPATIRLIRWKNGSESRLYACSNSGIALFDVALGVNHGSVALSVYVQSDYFEELWHKGLQGLEELDQGFIKLHEVVKNVVRTYCKEITAKNAAEAVQKLKKEDVYPYKGEPLNSVDKAERQVFDICTLKVHEVVPEFTKRSKNEKKLTLALLKETLRQRPSALNNILSEIFELSKDQLNELSEILNKTSLSSMIKTTKMVSDRLKFINGLEQILYGKDFSKHLKERSQLQKILLNELWLFGEHYTYGCDDVKLYNVLDEYASYLGRSEIANNLSPDEIEDMKDIPDICLWQQYSMGRPDVVENLIIELKRPSKVIGNKEVEQIESYARVVAENSRFPKDKTHWTFLLINTKFDDNVTFKMDAQGRENGRYLTNGNITIYVKKWGDILTEARARYHFLEEQLNVTVNDNNEGIAYLQQKYSQLLPKVIQDFNTNTAS